MTSLNQRYAEITKLNPNRSTINCFVVAVAGQGYEQKEIRSMFKELVDPREYQAADAKGLYYPLIDAVSPKNRQIKFAGMKLPKRMKVEKVTKEVTPEVVPDEHALN